jgi:putative sigma-54 modulation protein
MPLQITARNFELSAETHAHIEAKVDRFRKLVDQISVLDVIVTLQRRLYKIEVVVKTHCFNAAGSETDADLRAAVDRVMGKVERQLHKQIDKRRTAKRHPREVRERLAVTLTLPVLGEALSEKPEEESRIVRSHRIAAKPMSVQEAADQLEVEAGSFLVFSNADTEQINIIYRREDGRFGLIEPS